MGGEPLPKWRNLRSFSDLQNDAPLSSDPSPHASSSNDQKDITRRTRDDESM